MVYPLLSIRAHQLISFICVSIADVYLFISKDRDEDHDQEDASSRQEGEDPREKPPEKEEHAAEKRLGVEVYPREKQPKVEDV